MSEGVAVLLEFLTASGRQNEARALAVELAAAGVDSPMIMGDGVEGTEAADRSRSLVHLEILSLDEVLAGFDQILDRVGRRIRFSGRLRDAATLITMLSSSGVVISAIQATGASMATTICGLTALASSVATFLAGRLNGGEVNLTGRYADVSVKVAEAKTIRNGLKVHLAEGLDPEYVDQQLATSLELVRYLRHQRAELSIV